MPDEVIQLIPFTIVWLIVAPIAWRVARRKGVRPLVRVIGLFPVWIGVFAFYWASLTDKDVLDRLRRLEGARP